MLRWPGRGDRRGFAATPLSPAVPLDGTDTVQGLRQLAREADVGRIEGLLGAAARNGFAPGRRYARYRGPYLEHLTVGDVRAPPRPWAEWAGKARGPALPGKPPPPRAWGAPESVDALRERGEENFVHYLPNYVRLAVATVVLVGLATKPLSLVGVACLGGLGYANATGLLGPAAARGRGAAAGAGPGPAQPSPAQPTPPLRAFASLAAYGLAAYTRGFGTLARGGAMAAVLCTVHACLRTAPGEAAAAARLGRQAGVGFWDLMRGPTQGCPDPRRVLRELAVGVVALARAAVTAARLGAGSAADLTNQYVRAALARARLGLRPLR